MTTETETETTTKTEIDSGTFALEAPTLPALREALARTGAKPEHVRRILLAWMGRAPWAADAKCRYPAALERALPEVRSVLESIGRVECSDAESAKLLLAMRAGDFVEAVLLPREGLCVSTQVGCAVGCRFCMTGRSGLVRQLGSLEILAQVREGLRRMPGLSKIKFMGMGEPSHNLRAVMEALEFLGSAEGLAFAHKALTVSTVGDERLFEALERSPVKPALALSLHTTNDMLRRELLPRVARIPVEKLLDSALRYGDLAKFPVQIEWTLLSGVNDGLEEAERLAGLLKGRRAMVNYIDLNAVPGSDFSPVPESRAQELITVLRRSGTVATLRKSAARTVEGGCGQLRAVRLAGTARGASTT